MLDIVLYKPSHIRNGQNKTLPRPQSKTHKGHQTNSHIELFKKPQGVPRGFLRLYLLRQICEKPSHGYDILRTIEEKTNGSWRPGAGSIYPILKELGAEKLIKIENVPSSATSQRIYEITQNGREFLDQSGDTLLKAGRNWETMRNIWVDLADPRDVASMFPHMSTGSLEFVRKLLEAKKAKIPKQEVRRLLKEYLINLERQIDWTKNLLKQLE